MSERLSTFLRSLAIGVVVGTAIAFTSYLCAYFNLRAEFDRFKNNDLRGEFAAIRQALEEAKGKLGRYPASLEDLDAPQLSSVRGPSTGVLGDPWGKPLVYRSDGTSYSLMSLGRDGRPGGIGLDADRDSSPNASVPVPTFRQFTFDLPTGNLRLFCGLLGLIVLVEAVLERMGAPENRILALVSLPVVFAMTVGMASVMSIVHIPSGH